MSPDKIPSDIFKILFFWSLPKAHDWQWGRKLRSTGNWRVSPWGWAHSSPHQSGKTPESICLSILHFILLWLILKYLNLMHHTLQIPAETTAPVHLAEHPSLLPPNLFLHPSFCVSDPRGWSTSTILLIYFSWIQFGRTFWEKYFYSHSCLGLEGEQRLLEVTTPSWSCAKKHLQHASPQKMTACCFVELVNWYLSLSEGSNYSFRLKLNIRGLFYK